MVQRQDIEFTVEGDVTLRGWLFVPDGPGPYPGITMAHGVAGVKEHGLERFARLFADAGFVVLVHDHRGFGASDGSPRFDVGPDRIGLWGTSYAGGHAIMLGVTDRRLRAVVAQVPTISGYAQSLRRVAPDQVAALEAGFIDDERRLFQGDPPATQAVVSSGPAIRAAYRSEDAIAFYNQPVPEGVWTLHDTITVTDLALAAYERAPQPKKLVMIAGGHFDPYLDGFAAAGGAARDWFTEHLTH